MIVPEIPKHIYLLRKEKIVFASVINLPYEEKDILYQLQITYGEVYDPKRVILISDTNKKKLKLAVKLICKLSIEEAYFLIVNTSIKELQMLILLNTDTNIYGR